MVKYIFLRPLVNEFGVSLTLSDSIPAHYIYTFNRLYGENVSFRNLVKAFKKQFAVTDIFFPWNYDEERLRKKCFVDALMTLCDLNLNDLKELQVTFID